MFKHIDLPQNFPIIKDITTATGKRFYITPEGNQYPSVTTILGQKEKPWLKDWTNMLGETNAKKEQKRCADRGTAIHSMIENYLNNHSTPTKGFDAKHIAGFNQIKFKLNGIDNIRAQEVALYSDTLQIAGRVDCVAEYKNQLSIIDFKTSNGIKTRDMIEDYFLQATAYALMWEEMTGEHINNIVIIMSVERELLPLVFEDVIDKYVKPLITRVLQYHRKNNQ